MWQPLGSVGSVAGLNRSTHLFGRHIYSAKLGFGVYQMTTANALIPSPKSLRGMLPDLVKYLEASRAKFQTCVAEIKHDVKLDEPKATVHLQYIQFDRTNAEPKFDLFAKVLAKHIVSYTLSVRTRNQMKASIENEDEGELFIKARDYFRKIESAGEVGELLLFFLLEAALGAPQVVCKMELKTNPKDEVKGADGIHVLWDERDGHLDVFLGESKLYADISKALSSVFESLTEFYDLGRLDEELHLVTSHFKHVDSDFQNAVLRFVNRETTDQECHIVHACLIGWNWSRYKELVTGMREEFFKQFDEHYAKYVPTIEKMLNERFAGCKHKHITFKFLFLPFRSVGEFRRAFYKELCGVDIGQVDDQ